MFYCEMLYILSDFIELENNIINEANFKRFEKINFEKLLYLY